MKPLELKVTSFTGHEVKIDIKLIKGTTNDVRNSIN